MLGDNIRQGDKLRLLSNNVLVSHVARSTIASRVVEITLHEAYARMVAFDLGECAGALTGRGSIFIDFLLDFYDTCKALHMHYTCKASRVSCKCRGF